MRSFRSFLAASALTSINAWADEPPASSGDSAKEIVSSSQSAEECKGGCGTRPWDSLLELGLRANLMTVQGPDDATTVGFVFAGHSAQYWRNDILTVRGSSHFALGGGTGGVEGSLGGFVTGGVRAPLGEAHGLFARVGFGGELLGNSQFYFSHIDLPLGEVGYGFERGRYLFEVGGRISPTLTGRYNTGDAARRELGSSFSWSPYFVSRGRYSRFEGSFTRFETRQDVPGTPVNVARGAACAYAADLIAICLEGMYFAGKEAPVASTAAAMEATAFYGGVTVGLLSWPNQTSNPLPKRPSLPH